MKKVESPIFVRQEIERYFKQAEVRLRRHFLERRKLDRRTAKSFTVFRFFDTNENLLADILKFLLDPRETHGQQYLFLELFVNRLDRKNVPGLDNAIAAREAPTYSIPSYRRRVDLVVSSPNLVIALENKVDAPEGGKQLEDYYNHLRKIKPNDYCLVFLTPSGRHPTSISEKFTRELQASRKLYCLSYVVDIHKWLSDCKHRCEANNVSNFLDNIIDYIETYFQSATDEYKDF